MKKITCFKMILAVSVALNMGLSDMCQSRQLFTRARAQHIPSHSGLHKSDLGWRLVCIFVQFLKGTLLVEIREGPPRNTLGVFEQCFFEEGPIANWATSKYAQISLRRGFPMLNIYILLSRLRNLDIPGDILHTALPISFQWLQPAFGPAQSSI